MDGTAVACDCQAHQLPEPYLDLETAATLLQMTASTFKHYVSSHQAALSPPVYRWSRRNRRTRMLPASDVRTLQALRFRPKRTVAA